MLETSGISVAPPPRHTNTSNKEKACVLTITIIVLLPIIIIQFPNFIRALSHIIVPPLMAKVNPLTSSVHLSSQKTKE